MQSKLRNSKHQIKNNSTLAHCATWPLLTPPPPLHPFRPPTTIMKERKNSVLLQRNGSSRMRGMEWSSVIH